MFICLASQTDVNQTVHTSPTKKEMLLKSQIAKKNIEIKKWQKLLKEKQKKPQTFDYEYLKTRETELKFLTGVPNTGLCEWVLQNLQKDVPLIVQCLGLHNHLLLVLMKLKLGLLNRDLGIRFGINDAFVSKIFRSWILPLASLMKNFIVWPERDTVRQNLPSCFMSFKNCICIIDCTEIFIERPLNMNARAQTFSNYKSTNTIKYLIGIAPSGGISFLSAGWGGKASDKLITLNSGFLDMLSPGDCVLADRGFLVEEELATVGAVLRIPAFTRGKKQLTARDVDISRQIAHVRIHVERVIGRFKKFKITSSVIPISQVDLLNEIMVTVCGLTNLNPSVVNV